MSMSRRGFLKSAAAGLPYLAGAATVPIWVQKAAAAVCANGLPEDRILVIFQQAGGNDGLNTVIPYTDPKYLATGAQALRPTLHITSGYNELGDGLNALHPNLVRLKNWYSNGNVAVVNNVGYPNPSLSHFSGTDFWELGQSPGTALTGRQGWISRYFDSQCNGMPPDVIDPLSMMAASIARVPLTLANSGAYVPPAVGSFPSYSVQVPTTPATYGDLIKDYIFQANGQTVPIDSALDFVCRGANIAQLSAADMARAAQTPVISTYPANSPTLGPGLEMVSRVIRTDFPKIPTRVFYVTQTGYDTHANQITAGDVSRGTHADLLDEMDQALDAFLNDMAASGNLGRVTLMSFSEFGRRPQENGSRGTDHGTANCLFVMGGLVNGGVYGGQPDLVNLLSGNQGGNLQFNVDFRSVFSVVLRDWLGGDPAAVFGADFTSSAFNIATGMAGLPLFDNSGLNETVPASSGGSLLAGALIAAAAGAALLGRDREDSAAAAS